MILENVLPKERKWHRVNNTKPTNTQGTYHAEIGRSSIRVFGIMTNHVNGPQQFNKTFKVGDCAEYGSYNLIYTGTITNIGPKSVSIAHGTEQQPETTRLSIYEFIDRNWNFDAEKIEKYNLEESMCI